MPDIKEFLEALSGLVPKVDLSMLKIGNLDFNAVKELSLFKEARLSLVNANNFQMIINLAVSKNSHGLMLDNIFIGAPKHTCYQLDRFIPGVPSLNLVASPFSTGIHLVLENNQWLLSREPYELSAQTRLLPVSEQNRSPEIVLEGERKFTVSFESGIPRVISWKWDHKVVTEARIEFSDTHEYKNSVYSDNWIMTPMALDAPHSIDEQASLVMTFSSTVVAQVWKLVRFHLREKRTKQTFVYVVAKSA